MLRSSFLQVPHRVNPPRPRSMSPSSPSFRRLDSHSPVIPRQSLYRYAGDGAWRPIAIPSSPSTLSPGRGIPRFRLFTWNVDFSTPCVEERIIGILNCIQNYVLSTPNTKFFCLDVVPAVLLFQEVNAEAVDTLLDHPFIQGNYDVTDLSTRNFDSHYGTITCVPHTLTPFVTSISRIPFENSAMGRDALILDLDFPHFPNSRYSFPCQPIISRISICNTHLESLRGHGDRERPKQLRLICQLLSSTDGGLVAGDMNPITPEDHEVPSRLGLNDAWEVLHSDDPPEAGYTWGYQPPSMRFPPERLDKVLFTGTLRPVSIERFGVGKTFTSEGSQLWLSDHYGLVADFTVG